MVNKDFSERLSHLLDQIEVPARLSQRTAACAILFNITQHQAQEILRGRVPKSEILEKIAQVCEVNQQWLISKKNKRVN